MLSGSDPGEVFVGREGEQRAFAATLGELAAAKRKRWPFAESQSSRQQARVFLIHGSGGLGKTLLLRRFAQQCNEHGDHIKWVLLNWDDVHDAGNLPRDFPALALCLYNTIARQMGKLAQKHFQAFVTTHENHGKIQEKVKRYTPEARAEYTQLVSALAGTAGGMVGEAVGVPWLEKPLSAGLEYTVHVGAAAVAKFEDFLSEKLEQYLPSDEYRLYSNPNDQYASTFVRGLIALSESHPIVIAQDTFEWISSSSQLDSQLRARIIKLALEQSDTVAFVVAGRGDLSGAYRRTFESESHLLYISPIKPFNVGETRALLEAYELESELSSRIQTKTLGVPLAVDTLATLLKQAGQKQVTTHFPDLEAIVDEGDVIRQTTMRFLRYIVETPQDSSEVARQKISDRHQIYMLALLRKYDAGALGVCWGVLEDGKTLSNRAVLERLQALRQRNEFLFERGDHRMQSLVHHYIREHLRQQIQPDAGFLEREIVHKLNQVTLDYYEQELATRERSLPTLAERTEDAEWRSLCLNTLNHKFWLDERDALPDLCRRVLEAANFQSNWLPELVQIAKEAQPADQSLIRAFDEGVQSFLAEHPNISALQKMWEEVGQRLEKWNLPPLYRALLADRQAPVLAVTNRPLEAAQEVVAGLDALPAGAEPGLREGLVDRLVGVAAILVIEVRDYERAISVARQALQYDPDHIRAQHMRVMGLMGLKDYDGAHALLNELIEEHPDTLELLWLRQLLYNLQGRKAEADEVLRQIAQVRPEFAQDVVRAFVELGKDPEALKAVSEWGQDLGWGKDIEVFSKLLSTLSPEVLTELMSAQFELMAAESPTPEQTLDTRELFAHHVPDWPDVQADLGMAYLKVGRMEDALAAFERAGALAPDDPRMVTAPGLVLYWRGHRAEALPFLTKSARLLPDNSGPPLMITSCLLELGRWDEARTRVEAALRNFPDVSMVRWMYGRVLLASGDEEKGWQEQRAAYQADPNILQQMEMDVLLGALMGLENLKQIITEELGEQVGEILTSLPPKDMARLYVEMVRAQLEAEESGKFKPEVMIPVLEELLETQPASPQVRLDLAKMYDEIGQGARAITLLADSVEQTAPPERTQMHWMLTVLYFGAREIELATHHLQEFVKASPIPEAYQLLADLHEAASEIEEAMNAYDKALALADEQDVERLRKFGLYNLSFDRFERTGELFRMLIVLQPDDALAHAYLAEALYRQGRYEEAKASGEQALTLAPDAPDPAARLSRICEAMGLHDDAESYQQKALQALPSLMNYDQACVLAILGRQDEALARLAEALQEIPEQRNWAARDPDLSGLHPNAAFEHLIKD